MNKLITYIRESVGEMKKVTWPTKSQTVNYTLVVIALSIGMALFFALLDWIFNRGIESLI